MTKSSENRLRVLTNEYLHLAEKLRQGGGQEKVEKIHKQGKLTARERIGLLLDKDAYAQEIGLLVAYDEYGGDRLPRWSSKKIKAQCVVIANDATIKAGAWYRDDQNYSVLRRSPCGRVPIYLVDSAGIKSGTSSPQYGGLATTRLCVGIYGGANRRRDGNVRRERTYLPAHDVIRW